MESKRNIVVILCGQLRKDYMPMYGCHAVEMPNLDNLASNGCVYDNATTVSPVCAPARASMMTGRYVTDHNVWSNDLPFREGLEYLPLRMKELGYKTGAFGKLHHYPADDSKGFDVSVLMEENRLGSREPYNDYLLSRGIKVDNIFKYGRRAEDYYERFIATNACEFIANNSDEPLFAWVSFQGPHGPCDPPKEFKKKVRLSKVPKTKTLTGELPSVIEYRRAREYSGMRLRTLETYKKSYLRQFRAIDEEIGRIIDTLKAKGIYEQTDFIFSADHGELIGDYGMFCKGPYQYKAQYEIPLMVLDNANKQGGIRSDILASNMDIPATVLELAGDNRGIGCSKSLISEIDDREWVYGEFGDSVKIVENKDYRYSFYPMANETQLFKKPDENSNLAGIPKYEELELAMMQQIVIHYAIANSIDITIVSLHGNTWQDLADVLNNLIIKNGVRMEADDMVPKVQLELDKLSPSWRDELIIAFPIGSKKSIKSLKKFKLDSGYNEFCRSRKITRSYGVYWDDELYK